MRILVEPCAHHHLNLGDVAMLQVAVDRLRARWPDAWIGVITDAPDRLAEAELERLFRRHDFEPLEFARANRERTGIWVWQVSAP